MSRPDVGATGDFDGMILDLDGVVWLGESEIDGAAAAIERLRSEGTRVVFLTNDPRSSRAEYARRLAALGVPVAADDIVTAASALAAVLHEAVDIGTPTFAIGSPAFKEELRIAGLNVLDGEAGCRVAIVAVGGHDDFNYAELRIATSALRAGARLYSAGRDATFPMPDGPWPGTGAILAAVEVAGAAEAIVVGKPEAGIFAVARARLGNSYRVAMVGDNLVSDILGGQRAGLTTILVLSGTARPGDLDVAAVQPDFVVSSLASLVRDRRAARPS
jgi:phosphoglycolate/pyridoxal phosphate phosphatase family enzyme